ncbi:MAG: 2-pyrone-4,6-dicarboxylate hydrolase [Alphaproteobacteria bacterium]|nr:MAG: 2-pyrone-4,6-dicarboxylate hydrolase [Alphaproteobacteria bacterium]
MSGYRTNIPAAVPKVRVRDLPLGSCDTHTHVFGGSIKYPMPYVPNYPVPLATPEIHLNMLEILGITRSVVVQPTQYGSNVDLLIDALRNSENRLRGVAAARSDTTDEALQTMQDAGVRGLRFVHAFLPNGKLRPGAIPFDEINLLSSRMNSFGWSVNVWAQLPNIMENIETLLKPNLPVVLEHIGMVNVEAGLDDQNFVKLLSLVREQRISVKISLCRCSKLPPKYNDLKPFVDALIDANPNQLLWGSDWPYIRMIGEEPDAGELLDLMKSWVDGDDDILEKILVTNPEQLYGF